jgi:hypothetical protein
MGKKHAQKKAKGSKKQPAPAPTIPNREAFLMANSDWLPGADVVTLHSDLDKSAVIRMLQLLCGYRGADARPVYEEWPPERTIGLTPIQNNTLDLSNMRVPIEDLFAWAARLRICGLKTLDLDGMKSLPLGHRFEGGEEDEFYERRSWLFYYFKAVDTFLNYHPTVTTLRIGSGFCDLMAPIEGDFPGKFSCLFPLMKQHAAEGQKGEKTSKKKRVKARRRWRKLHLYLKTIWLLGYWQWRAVFRAEFSPHASTLLGTLVKPADPGTFVLASWYHDCVLKSEWSRVAIKENILLNAGEEIIEVAGGAFAGLYLQEMKAAGVPWDPYEVAKQDVGAFARWVLSAYQQMRSRGLDVQAFAPTRYNLDDAAATIVERLQSKQPDALRGHSWPPMPQTFWRLQKVSLAEQLLVIVQPKGQDRYGNKPDPEEFGPYMILPRHRLAVAAEILDAMKGASDRMTVMTSIDAVFAQMLLRHAGSWMKDDPTQQMQAAQKLLGVPARIRRCLPNKCVEVVQSGLDVGMPTHWLAETLLVLTMRALGDSLQRVVASFSEYRARALLCDTCAVGRLRAPVSRLPSPARFESKSAELLKLARKRAVFRGLWGPEIAIPWNRDQESVFVDKASNSSGGRKKNVSKAFVTHSASQRLFTERTELPGVMDVFQEAMKHRQCADETVREWVAKHYLLFGEVTRQSLCEAVADKVLAATRLAESRNLLLPPPLPLSPQPSPTSLAHTCFHKLVEIALAFGPWSFSKEGFREVGEIFKVAAGGYRRQEMTPREEMLAIDRMAVESINARTPWGSTALHYAVANGRRHIVSVLLNAGAKIDVCDDWGRTPLHYASMFGDLESRTMLMERVGGKLPPRYVRDDNLVRAEDGLTPMFCSLSIVERAVAAAVGRFDYERTGEEGASIIVLSDRKPQPLRDVKEPFGFFNEDETDADHPGVLTVRQGMAKLWSEFEECEALCNVESFEFEEVEGLCDGE